MGYNISTKGISTAYEAGNLRKDVSLSEGWNNSCGACVPVPYIEKFRKPNSDKRANPSTQGGQIGFSLGD